MGDWNFSELVQTLWKTCADNGVGALLRPGQKRRDAYADADVKRINAQAEYDADLIRRGEKDLADFQLASNRRTVMLEDRREPNLDLETLPSLIANQQTADGLRKEVNVAKALLHAEGELASDMSPAPKSPVDGDWLRRWRDYAGDVSSEELQSIWGRLLAGEVKSPGVNSLRTLDLLRNMSTEDAMWIAKLAPFALQGFVFRQHQSDGHNVAIEQADLPFGRLLYLEDIGIISGVMSGLTRSWPNTSGGNRSFETLLNTKEVGVLLSHPDKNITAEMPGFAITRPGLQILQLCDFTADRQYLTDIGTFFKKQGFKAELCDLDLLPDGRAGILSQLML